MTFRKYNLHVVMEPDEDCNTASAQTKDKKVEAKIVRRDEHEGGDEETFRAAKDPQDGDMAAAKMLDCVKSGDVEDCAKSGDVEDCVKSGDVEDCVKSGDEGNQAGAAVSSEVTPAPAVEQPQQAPCEESCERQQTSNCGNTEP